MFVLWISHFSLLVSGVPYTIICTNTYILFLKNLSTTFLHIFDVKTLYFFPDTDRHGQILRDIERHPEASKAIQ